MTTDIEKVLERFEENFGNTSDKQYDDWTEDYYLNARWFEVKDWLKLELTALEERVSKESYEKGWGKGWTEGYTEGVESMV